MDRNTIELSYTGIVVQKKKKKIVINSNRDNFLKHTLTEKSQTYFRTGKTSSRKRKIHRLFGAKRKMG